LEQSFTARMPLQTATTAFRDKKLEFSSVVLPAPSPYHHYPNFITTKTVKTYCQPLSHWTLPYPIHHWPCFCMCMSVSELRIMNHIFYLLSCFRVSVSYEHRSGSMVYVQPVSEERS